MNNLLDCRFMQTARYSSKECVCERVNKKVYRFFRCVLSNQQKLKKE